MKHVIWANAKDEIALNGYGWFLLSYVMLLQITVYRVCIFPLQIPSQHRDRDMVAPRGDNIRGAQQITAYVENLRGLQCLAEAMLG